MPRRYPVEFRRKVLDLIEAGRPVAEIAAQLGVTAQTIYNWRNQDQIDRGLRVGAVDERVGGADRGAEADPRAGDRAGGDDAGERVVEGPGGPKRRWEVVAQIVSEGLPIEVDLPRGRVSVSGFYMWRQPQAVGACGAPRDGRRRDPPGARRVAADLRRPPRARRAGARPQDDRGSLHGRAGDAPPRPGRPAGPAEVSQDPEHADRRRISSTATSPGRSRTGCG